MECKGHTHLTHSTQPLPLEQDHSLAGFPVARQLDPQAQPDHQIWLVSLPVAQQLTAHLTAGCQGGGVTGCREVLGARGEGGGQVGVVGEMGEWRVVRGEG